MKALTPIIWGLVVLLLLFWAPGLEVVRRTIMPWRERRKREAETGVQRELIVQLGPFKIIDRPIPKEPSEPAQQPSPSS